jgi:hypothetical protein
MTAVFWPVMFTSVVVSCVAAEYLLLRGPGYAAVPGAAAGGRAGDCGGGANHRQEADLQGFRGHRQESSQPAHLLVNSSILSGVPDP